MDKLIELTEQLHDLYAESEGVVTIMIDAGQVSVHLTPETFLQRFSSYDSTGNFLAVEEEGIVFTALNTIQRGMIA